MRACFEFLLTKLKEIDASKLFVQAAVYWIIARGPITSGNKQVSQMQVPLMACH